QRLSRAAARKLITDEDGKRWRLEKLPGKGQPTALLPLQEPDQLPKPSSPDTPTDLPPRLPVPDPVPSVGDRPAISPPPARGAPAEKIPCLKNPHEMGLSEKSISAAPDKWAGGNTTLPEPTKNAGYREELFPSPHFKHTAEIPAQEARRYCPF